jgi:ABC-type bacteriocin/lantibiotic exporter with double-glycine peptidase domain
MNQHDVKEMADGAAVSTAFFGMMGWMEPTVVFITSICSLIYLLIRIWETDTVQKLVKRNAK